MTYVRRIPETDQKTKRIGTATSALKNPGILDQIKAVRKKIDDILLEEVEGKARFSKQTYYEGGPKATKRCRRGAGSPKR